jgi:hypothetical protein
LPCIGACPSSGRFWLHPALPAQASNGLGRGGRPFPPREGTPEGTPPSIAANITSHPTAGIGAWSDQKIARAITQGVSRDGRALKPPMAFSFYAGLKDGDLAAIIAYLRTVPPLQ